jgi:hypothetical protein
VNILSSIKPWLGFLFDLLAGQEILRKTPWIDKIFLLIGKGIKKFLRWLSVVSTHEYLLEKLEKYSNFFLTGFVISLPIVFMGFSLNLPHQLLLAICGTSISTLMPVFIFAVLKGILEFFPKFKLFSSAYLNFCAAAMFSCLFILVADAQDEKHPFYSLIQLFYPFGAGASIVSMALTILGFILILLVSPYLVVFLVIGGPSSIASIFLYATSKLAKELERMTNSNVQAVAFFASLILHFIPD